LSGSLIMIMPQCNRMLKYNIFHIVFLWSKYSQYPVRGWIDAMALMQLEGLGELKKSSDLIGNRTCDLPAGSIVPPRFPFFSMHKRSEFCEWMVGTSAYLECSVLRSAILTTISWFFSVPSDKCQSWNDLRYYPQIRPRTKPSTSFPVHLSSNHSTTFRQGNQRL
jgi:hypothetical protein